MSKLDLWPDNLLEEIPTSPSEILAWQAALLGPKTQNIILADVDSMVDSEDGIFLHRFYLRVPSLSNYEFDLFSVYHGVDLYPVKEVNSERVIDDEEQLNSFIAEKLSSEEAIKIIRALASQTRQIKQRLKSNNIALKDMTF